MKVKELKEYKVRLYTALSRDLGDFERNFLIIAGAVFSFTITFLNDVIVLYESKKIEFLFFCWLCLILSIALMMFTFLYSANSSDRLNKLVNNYMTEYELSDDDMILCPNLEKEFKRESYDLFYKCKNILKYMRYSAVFFFIIGISFLSIFVGYNIYFK